MKSAQSTLSKRSLLLKSLLSLDSDLPSIVSELNKTGWDSEEELVMLEGQHIISVLERYLNQTLSALDVEDWANAIECREDIAYEKHLETTLERAIEELANPLLTRPLSDRVAREWIQHLTTSYNS